MSEAKSIHTPGVWQVDETGTGVRGPREVERIAVMVTGGTVVGQSNEVYANARRIVECVNACEGLVDPSAVPDLLSALRSASDLLPMCSCDNGVYSPSGDSEGEHWLRMLKKQVDEALRKATGGT